MPTHTHDHATASEFSAAPIQPGESGSLQPEFIRVPDVERIFGIKRGHCYALIGSGAVKSVCLRKPGAKTGVRLVSYASIREHLNSHMEGGK